MTLNLKKTKIIFWDFDGVIMDSMAVRDNGFAKVLADFPENQVEQLLSYHRANGGLSRYVKFRYFFEVIRGESITESGVKMWAERFSIIMKELLTDRKLLILETVNFIRDNHQNYYMHIVSGSDQTELRYLCANLGIASFFKSIHGSPTPKIELVKNLIEEHNYSKTRCILIGDSGNDYDAASQNGIDFLAYNNKTLEANHPTFNPATFNL